MAERLLYYLDFEAGEFKPLDEGDVATNLQLPLGYVVANTSNTDPATELGYGYWLSLGSQTIGATTVYYFERATP